MPNQGAPCYVLGDWGCRIFVVLNVLPWNSHSAPIKFSIHFQHVLQVFYVFSNLFSIAPHFIPNALPKFYSCNLDNQVKGGITTYSFWECWKIDTFLWWANQSNDSFLVKIYQFSIFKKVPTWSRVLFFF
jgi:hypothetical protein